MLPTSPAQNMDQKVSQFLDYLQVKNEFGQTIYGHLAQIIAKLLDDRPKDAVSAMAQISKEIKASAGVSEANNNVEDLLTEKEYGLINTVLQLLSQKQEIQDEEKLEPTHKKTIVQNILQLNQKLNILGKGFDEQTALILQKHLNDFVEARKGYFTEVSVFGRVETTSGYYYIIECLPAKPRKHMYRFQGQEMKSAIPDTFKQHKIQKQFVADKKVNYLTAKQQKKLADYLSSIMDKLDEDKLKFDLSTIPPAPKFTAQTVYPRGDNIHPQGVNRFIYFVTTEIFTQNPEWTRLPDLESRQLRISRFISGQKLSGFLERRIFDKIPPFPGVEAHYLRCLITRIKHGSQIAPQVCLKVNDPPEEEEEELNEEQQKLENADKQIAAADAENFSKQDVEPESLKEKLLKKFLINWPVVNDEMEEVEFESLVKFENWVHCCPVLSHKGIVLPFEVPEEAEPEEEKTDDGDAEAEDEEPEKQELENENGEDQPEEEKEPLPPTVQERLATMFKESDQQRILEESVQVLKEAGKQKCVYKIPKAHWELVRDPWDAARKENKDVYQIDRFFNAEIAPVDINAKQQELPEKEQAYWDKEAGKEEVLKALDEQFAEGDIYDAEKEVPSGEKPDILAPANNDAEIIVHNVVKNEVSVTAESALKIQPYKAIFDKLLFKNSPVIMESNRWAGMMNVCYNYSGAEAITYTSIYIGNGQNVQQHNAFDVRRFCLPPPMCAVPADLLEEVDPHFEIEKECKERVIDMERKDQEKAERKRLELEEKKKIEEQERKLQEAENGEDKAEEEKQEGDAPAANEE